MEININFVFFLLILFFGWYYVHTKFQHWADREILTVKPTFPIGNVLNLQKTDSMFILQKIYNRFYKRDVLCGMYLVTTPVILVMDLEVIKNILITNFVSFHDRGEYYNEKTDPLSANLYSIEGLQWKLSRNRLNSILSYENMNAMFDKILYNATVLKKISFKISSKPVDIHCLSTRFIADTIGNYTFGIDFNSQYDGKVEIIKICNRITTPSWLRNLYIMLLNTFPRVCRILDLKLYSHDITKYFLNIIEDKCRGKYIANSKNFLNMLLDLKSEEVGEGKVKEANMDHLNEMAGDIFTFIFPGFKTSPSVISFTLYELAENQGIQQKVREEINKILEKHNGILTNQAIDEMQYLAQVLNETLRKYPPVSYLTRVLENKYKVPNSSHILERGTKIIIPVYAIHHNPDIYPEPHIFDPERFTEENFKKRHEFAFLAFGAGPRNCIGNKFARIQSLVGIITIIMNFRVTVCSRTVKPITFDPESSMLTVVGGLWLNFDSLT